MRTAPPLICGTRDEAIIAVLLDTGAREEECARLETDDITITARTGSIRLHSKGDQVRDVPLPPIARTRLSAWLDERGREPGPLWDGQRGILTVSGIVQVVLAVGEAAKLPEQTKKRRQPRLRVTVASTLPTVSPGLLHQGSEISEVSR